MSLFDSIIGSTAEKFGLGSDKAGSLLTALVGLISSPQSGGFTGFLDRFTTAGLGDKVSSWITTGDNTPVTNEEMESALGAETLDSVAADAGVDRATATSAMAYMMPQVVDKLTPDGEIPDEQSLLSKLGGYLTGFGGAAAGAVLGGLGAVGAATSGAAGKVGDAAGATYDKSKEMVGGAAGAVGDAAGATYDKGKEIIGGGIGAVGDAAGAVGDRVSGAIGSVGNAFDGDGSSGGGSILRWLLPLLLLGLLIVLGYWFCGRSTPTTTVTNTNVNKPATNAANTNAAAKTVDSSFKLEAKDGKYIASGVVPDQATLDKIKTALTAQFGAGNVDFAGLRVDANAKPFAAGWWDNFAKVLPNLKDWKTGLISFSGNAIETASGLPQAAIDQIKSLFSGWTLPVSIAGAETATKQANEEALKELGEADSVDEVVKALNVSIINFASGKSDIPADAKPILTKAAEVLKKQVAGTTVEIGGYTDNKGNADANKKLSQARADAVKKELVALGVSEAMLKSVGYGDANPVGDNNTEDGRFKNRRIEYKTGTGGAPTATTTTTTTNSNGSK